MSDIVLLYDGVCGLCNRIVRFTLKYDRKKIFRFAALQNDYGQVALRKAGLSLDQLDTFMLIEDGLVRIRSDAAFRTLSLLGWPWRMIAALRVLPRALTDRCYDFVARHRYGWFGTYDTCPIPSAETRSRFID